MEHTMGNSLILCSKNYSFIGLFSLDILQQVNLYALEGFPLTQQFCASSRGSKYIHLFWQSTAESDLTYLGEALI